jgi:hypothetical protein
MVGRGDCPKKIMLKMATRMEKEKKTENLDILERDDDDDDIHIDIPTPSDELKISKNHIKAEDEKLIRHRKLIATILKQNEGLVKTIKALQES